MRGGVLVATERQGDLAIVRIQAQYLHRDRVSGRQLVRRRQLGDMQQAFEVLVQADEDPEVRHLGDDAGVLGLRREALEDLVLRSLCLNPRVVRELQETSTAVLVPDPVDPFGASTVTYQCTEVSDELQSAVPVRSRVVMST